MTDPLRFLSRWSRLKRQATANAVPPTTDAATETRPPATTIAGTGPAGTPAPTVPGNEAAPAAGVDADITAGLQAGASEVLRRQALKQLFADPHFNVMDGLDVYIDDYSIADPIPEAMLAGLNQMQRLFPDAPAPAADADADAVAASARPAVLPDEAPATSPADTGDGAAPGEPGGATGSSDIRKS